MGKARAAGRRGSAGKKSGASGRRLRDGFARGAGGASAAMAGAVGAGPAARVQCSECGAASARGGGEGGGLCDKDAHAPVGTGACAACAAGAAGAASADGAGVAAGGSGCALAVTRPALPAATKVGGAAAGAADNAGMHAGGRPTNPSKRRRTSTHARPQYQRCVDSSGQDGPRPLAAKLKAQAVPIFASVPSVSQRAANKYLAFGVLGSDGMRALQLFVARRYPSAHFTQRPMPSSGAFDLKTRGEVNRSRLLLSTSRPSNSKGQADPDTTAQRHPTAKLRRRSLLSPSSAIRRPVARRRDVKASDATRDRMQHRSNSELLVALKTMVPRPPDAKAKAQRATSVASVLSSSQRADSK